MTVREYVSACNELDVPNFAFFDITWGIDHKRKFIELYDWQNGFKAPDEKCCVLVSRACRGPLAPDSCRVANLMDIVGHPFLSGYIRLSTISASPVDRVTSPTAAFVGDVPECFHLRRAIRAMVDLKGPEARDVVP